MELPTDSNGRVIDGIYYTITMVDKIPLLLITDIKNGKLYKDMVLDAVEMYTFLNSNKALFIVPDKLDKAMIV
jgi:hypothetical protein